MGTDADLEIAIRRLDGLSSSVEMRFTPPDSDTEVRLLEETPVSFDTDKLAELVYNDEEYGVLLYRSLFADEGGAALAQARQDAASKQATLRLRLFIAPTAERLHTLRWETLRDPADGASLLTNENLVFSRYLSSRDWRPVGVTPKSDLDALTVIANPRGLDQWPGGGQPYLQPVDVEGERQRAREGLGGMRSTELASGGTATLDGLIEALRGGPEVLYLACHGYLSADGQPQVLLEDAEGAVHRVAGSEMLARLAELPVLPRLVVLASCQSAGTGTETTSLDRGALAALGPRLAEMGVPAVIGMQGNVTMATVAAFMPAFFRELDRDGLIDRAVATARGTVRDRHDWWMPVLYMRLKSGRLWYVPGFAGPNAGFERWPAVLNDIRQGRCLPIVGPGLAENLLGPRSRFARDLAARYRFPLASHDQDDLADVAQYLWSTQSEQLPVDELKSYLLLQADRWRADFPPDLRDIGTGTQVLSPKDLERLITALWEVRRQAETTEPYTVLASLPFPVFVTTQPVGLLTAALEAAGKTPKVDFCRWNSDVDWPPSVYDDDPNFEPSEQSPLVYHLFGQLTIEDSLVLTADSYFDFLIGLTANKGSIPSAVLSALSNKALFFLGFRMDEWDFRVLFRSIMNLQGTGRRRFSHVAAQVDPEGSQTLSPQGARRYLEQYLQHSKVDIYWGSADGFLRELHAKWQEGATTR